jgi:hypothetical protein
MASIPEATAAIYALLRSTYQDRIAIDERAMIGRESFF